MIGPSLALLALAALPQEAEVVATIARDFESVGRAIPPVDEALSKTARQVAERALVNGVEDASGLTRITAYLSRNGGWDPNPTAVVIRGEPEDLLSTLRKNRLTDDPVSLLGVGVAQEAGRGALAVLLARRRMVLDPFPRQMRKPAKAPATLCGTLLDGYQSAELFVTRPDGDVARADMQKEPRTGKTCGPVTLASAGRHTVEVLAKGRRGPEVAALFFVDVGATPVNEDSVGVDEPATDEAARAELLVRINALRLKMGLSPVAADRALDAIAQGWADRLASEGFFAHVGPDGSDLKARLAQADYAFVSAGENLGLSQGPLSAHFGIEHSPGHRRNLLDRDHQRLGIGLARRDDGLTVLVEILARPTSGPDADADPLGTAYRALNAERGRQGLPALRRTPALEGLALAHARAALAQNLPKASLPGAPSLHEKAFELLEHAGTISVDVFITPSPARVVDSANLKNPDLTEVGVGVVKGDSPTYGSARYWVVVIYAGAS